MGSRGRGPEKREKKERVRQGKPVHSDVVHDTGTESSSADNVSQADRETSLEPVNTQGSMRRKGLANVGLFRRIR